MSLNCPSVQHFHVSATHVDHTHLDFVILEDDPEAALAKVLEELPSNWKGSVEVSDDDNNGPSDLPLIDHWKE